jgi:hypothetical protein
LTLAKKAVKIYGVGQGKTRRRTIT